MGLNSSGAPTPLHTPRGHGASGTLRHFWGREEGYRESLNELATAQGRRV
jgi:hypothetical protein